MSASMRRILPLILIAGLVSCGANQADGAGDAPIQGADDTPWSVLNAPDRFPNVAFRCFKGNGLYSTRAAEHEVRQLEVVPNDPVCATQPK